MVRRMPKDPMYSREACHGIQVVKIHNQDEIFVLIVAFEVDESPEVNS